MAGAWKGVLAVAALLAATACGPSRSAGPGPGAEERAWVDGLNARVVKALATDPKGARTLAEEALAASRAARYAEGEALARYNLGEAHRTLDAYPQALECYEAARALFEAQENLGETARALRRLGDVQYFLARYDKAIGLYLDALRLEEALARDGKGPHALRAGHLQATLGNVFKATGDFVQAEESCRRALAVYEGQAYTLGVAGAHGNLASVYQDRGRFAEALEENLKALPLARSIGDDYLLSIVLANVGSVYVDLKRYNEAEPYLTESLAVCQRTERKRGILGVLMLQGRVQKERGRIPQALARFEKAQALAEDLGDPRSQADVQAALAELYAGSGDYRRAYEARVRRADFESRILDASKSLQINQLRVAYETEKKEQEIEGLKREKAFQDRIRWSLLGGIGLALVVLLLLVNLLRLRARHSREIESTSRELQETYSRVERLSRIDDLTQLLNRRAAWERIGQERARSERSGRAFALVLADLDDFKRVNDLYGHPAGDAVLVTVAGLIRGALREQDAVARWGGEEFLLLLPETDREGALQASEKVRQAVEQSPVDFGDRQVRVTLTLGVGVFDPIRGVEDALRRADEALYAGKAAGKNRVG